MNKWLKKQQETIKRFIKRNKPILVGLMLGSGGLIEFYLHFAPLLVNPFAIYGGYALFFGILFCTGFFGWDAKKETNPSRLIYLPSFNKTSLPQNSPLDKSCVEALRKNERDEIYAEVDRQRAALIFQDKIRSRKSSENVKKNDVVGSKENVKQKPA